MIRPFPGHYNFSVTAQLPHIPPIEEISSVKHPAVKLARSLAASAGRSKHGAFLAEGRKDLDLALRLGSQLQSVFISKPAAASFPATTLQQLVERHVPTYLTSRGIFAKILATRYEPAVECVSVVGIQPCNLKQILPTRPLLLLLCDRVADPRNLGLIVRTADAASASGLILSPGCADPYGRPAVRASTGSILTMPVFRDFPLLQAVTRLKAASLKIFASSAAGEKPLWETDLTAPAALILGSEADGVSEELRRAADATLRIPIAGAAHSLNVAVACGAILFERLRQAASTRRNRD